MKLEEILLKIMSEKNTYENFLKLQTEKEVYDFLQEKYNYEENFEDFCEIVKECKHEFLSSCDKNELAKISGGKLYNNYLKKIGIIGLSGVLAFNGLGEATQIHARKNTERSALKQALKEINPKDTKALAIGVPSTIGVGVIGIYLINKLVKSISPGSPSTSVPSFTSFTPEKNLNFTRLPDKKLCECYTQLFDAMDEPYKQITQGPDANNYGEVFWRQWYAALYVYTKICSETVNGKNRLSAGWPIEVMNVANDFFEKLSEGNSSGPCAIELGHAVDNAEMMLKSAQDKPIIDSVFTSLGTDNARSLVGAIHQCDRRVLPGILLDLKKAIDNDWEKIKQMEGEKFLNYAGCYKQNNKTPEK